MPSTWLLTYASRRKRNKRGTHESINQILCEAIRVNQLLNKCVFPFPLKFNGQKQAFKIRSTFLQIYWISPLFKACHALFLAAFAFPTMFNKTKGNINVSTSAPLLYMNISALLGTVFLDLIFISNADEIVQCFSWACKIETNYLATNKLGPFLFSKLIGYIVLVSTVGTTTVAVVAASYVGFLQLDTFTLLTKSLKTCFISENKVLKIVYFLLVIHEGQVMALIIRYLLILLLYQAICRMILLQNMISKPVNIENIKIYQQTRIVSCIIRQLEVSLVTIILSGAFFFVILSVGTLYAGLLTNDILMAIPTVAIAGLLICVLYFAFLFGSSIYKFSNNLLHKWKAQMDSKASDAVSRKYLKKVVKSLPPISVPAGTVGIIDIDIKMNYTDILLQKNVDTILAMKDTIK